MADNKQKLQSENTKSNFGKGWLIIFYSMIMFFFLIGFSIDGQNIVIDQWINANGGGADPTELKPQLLKLARYAGFIGVVAYFVIGRILVKVGGRALSAACLALAGASYIYYGHSTTTTGYFIGLTLVTVFINGAAYIGGGNLVTQWFPKKKGLANGYTTMGHNLGSAFYVPLISGLIGAFGIAKGMTMPGIAAIIIAVIAYFIVRNTPQERGMYPDNVSKEVYEAEYAQETENGEPRWTVAKLLKTKEMWFVAIIIGINQLVTTGVMSQMVPRNIELGFAPEKAVWLMTVCAVVGVCGSYGFGWLDQKLGVKKAVIMFLVWYCAALAVNYVLNSMLGGYICVAMVGVAIGAAANFMTSLPASVFGRQSFDVVYSIYFPVMQIVLMMNYYINAKALELTGSLRGAYLVFIGLLVVNVVLINCFDTKKYNLDYKREEELSA